MGGCSNQYDVFLSFRGSDTRNGFTDYLYRSLISVGRIPISVFRDDNSLEIGEDFNSEILNAITQSKISIPIISENYASSLWCLRELVHIMDCKKSMSHIVLPIFYKVLPSDVRYLKGNFGEAFRLRKKHFDKKDIQEGQRAFTEVSYLKGWESEKFANGHEEELVEEVIKTILSKLRHDFRLDVPKHLVGVDDHVNRIRNWVDTPASHARMIGIYGMGGIGKTTLAKVIYNEFSNDFVHCSFLPDIREIASRNGIPYLQNLLMDRRPNQHQIRTVDEGINLIKSRFKGRKVLILLDDVDHQDQLNALARERDWFSTGSIIVVTTRYQAVLHQPEFKVDYKYELTELDVVYSLSLFKRHAFSMGHCPKDFEGISCDILSTMGGLPLAIEVIGSYLYGTTNRKVWQDVLKKLRNEPHGDVQKKLKISYDALEPKHKEIFLDIACFFVGTSIEYKYAIYMWEDCDLYPNQGIEELKLRCLIRIGDCGEFMMHDQLRDLGRSIFRQGQPPERCLKLWLDEERLSKRMILAPGLANYGLDGCSSTYTSELFKTLPSSKFLQLCGKALSGDFNQLFSELRWLRWSYIEPNMFSSATNFHLSKLVVLELSLNKLPEDWSGWSSIVVAKQLKVLNLSNSQNLKCTPDFSTFTKLEILILRGCNKLKQVHPSIGKVKILISLDLSNCSGLKELPEEIGELQELKELLLDHAGITKIPTSIGSLRKLEELIARQCSSLVEIPLSIENLSSLQHLDLSDSSLSEIPSSIGNLSSLQYFNFSRRNLPSHPHTQLSHFSLREIPSSIGNLSSLKHLDLSGHGSLREIPSSIGNLSSLQHLCLFGCTSLREIPSSIGNLSSLQHLELSGHGPWREILSSIGESLREIPNSIGNLSSLQHLELFGCESLREIPSSIGNLSSLQHLKLSSCESLIEIPSSIGNLSSLEHLDLLGCGSLREIPSSIGSLSSLKHLCLSFCGSLKEIPNSVGNLSSLKELDLSHCKSLREIPIPIWDSQNLQCLDISNSAIEEFPSVFRRFKILRRLFLKGENLEHIHDFSSLGDIIGKIKNELPPWKKSIFYSGSNKAQLLLELPSGLTYLRVNSPISRLPQLSCLIHLEELYLCGYELELMLELPSRLLKLCVDSCPKLILPKFDEFKYLEELSIGHYNSIERMDLSQLNRLKRLHIKGCNNLVEIHGQGKLEFLETINIYTCKSIKRLILPKLQCLKRLEAISCETLVEIRSLDKMELLEVLHIRDCRSFKRLPNLSCFATLKEYNICCSQLNVPTYYALPP